MTRSIGLDPTGYSITYIAAWNSAHDSVIRTRATVIDETARRIEKAITQAA